MSTSEEAAVHIVPYDPAWPALFELERQLLSRTLRSWLAGPIEHVGSTAVFGLAAKPVIDVMAAVESLEASRDAVVVLPEAGYHYAPYRPEVMHWFCKPGFSLRTHHLHLVPYRSLLWTERIAFRDCLRSDAKVASEYAELKHSLAEVHRFDREAYTEAKAPFIARVLRNLIGKGRETDT